MTTGLYKEIGNELRKVKGVSTMEWLDSLSWKETKEKTVKKLKELVVVYIKHSCRQHELYLLLTLFDVRLLVYLFNPHSVSYHIFSLHEKNNTDQNMGID